MSLWSLIVKVKGDNSGLKDTLNDSKSKVNVFGDAVKKIGGAIAAAFAVEKIIAFGKEVVQLAAKAEGVTVAFNRIADPGILQGLRDATRGTVTDLQLMQAAVQANNFQIPLENLASLFKFASDRALQTGQSVDYLVDSIILGIGRKSPLILDNLGISAVRLREVLKGAGVEMSTVGDIAAAVGAIATEEMSKMGDMADTAATKIASISASWQNLKTTIGEKTTQSPIFQGLATWMQNIGKFAQAPGMTLSQAIWGATFQPKQFNTMLDEANKKILENAAAITKQKQAVQNVAALKEAKRGAGAAPNKVAIPGVSSVNITGFTDLPSLQPVNAELTRELNEMEKILMSGRDMAVDLGAQLVEGLGEALASGDLKEVGKQLLSSFAGFLSQFGKMLIAYGIAHTAFYESLTAGPVGGVIAIAAGTAALLAAGAIKGLMANTAKSGAGAGNYSANNTSMQNIKVHVVGKIKGKDIGIAMKRS